MRRQTLGLVLVAAAAVTVAPLLGCSRSAPRSDSPSTPDLVGTEGAVDFTAWSTGDPLSKQEIVAAALSAMHGCEDGPYSSACVSLNELLAVCPDIANAAVHEQDEQPCWSYDPEMSMPSDNPNMTRAHPCPQMSLLSAEGHDEVVELEDITVHFSVNGRVYQVVLSSPCLCDGEVYGGVEIPTADLATEVPGISG